MEIHPKLEVIVAVDPHQLEKRINEKLAEGWTYIRTESVAVGFDEDSRRWGDFPPYAAMMMSLGRDPRGRPTCVLIALMELPVDRMKQLAEEAARKAVEARQQATADTQRRYRQQIAQRRSNHERYTGSDISAIFSPRATKTIEALRAAGINKIGDIFKHTEESLRKILPNPSAMSSLRTAINDAREWFGVDPYAELGTVRYFPAVGIDEQSHFAMVVDVASRSMSQPLDAAPNDLAILRVVWLEPGDEYPTLPDGGSWQTMTAWQKGNPTTWPLPAAGSAPPPASSKPSATQPPTSQAARKGNPTG